VYIRGLQKSQVGVTGLALVSAVGGGITRDLIIG